MGSLSGKGGKIFGILFCLPFFGVGVGMGCKLAHDLAEAGAMKRWDPVPATVLSAKVDTITEHTSDGTSTSYRMRCSYKYTYQEKMYFASRGGYSDTAPFAGGLRKRTQILETTRTQGTTIPCYVNPESPNEAVIFPSMLLENIGFFLIFVVVFGGVGLGGFILIFRSGRKAKRAEALRQAHPDEPWKQNPEWASGVIKASTGKSVLFFWVFAIFWNAISSPLLFALKEELAKGNRAILIGLIFPIVGVCLLIAAITQTLRWRKYGNVELFLDPMPGVVGGMLRGAIRVPVYTMIEGPVALHLTCGKMVTTGSGKNRSTTRRILWEACRSVPEDNVKTSDQTLIPVTIPIPYTCSQTDDTSDIDWQLSVSAKTPGLDLSASFEIPVFKTEASDPAVTEDTIVEDEMDDVEARDLRALKRIEIDERESRYVIDVPPAMIRCPGMVTGCFVFTCIWSGVVWAIWRFGAPIMFNVIFTAVDIILIIALGHYTFTRSRVRADSEGVSIRRTFQPARMIPAADVLDIYCKRGAQSSTGSKTTTYYSVILERRTPDGSRKKHTLASTIPDKRAAQLLAAELMRRLPGHES